MSIVNKNAHFPTSRDVFIFMISKLIGKVHDLLKPELLAPQRENDPNSDPQLENELLDMFSKDRKLEIRKFGKDAGTNTFDIGLITS